MFYSWQWAITAVILTAHVVVAARPACGGNKCYPILKGPLANIAQSFCSGYLGYPKTSTVVKSTTVSTTVSTTKPGRTSSVTGTTTIIATTFRSTTVTIPGSTGTSTSTVTSTITVAALPRQKRNLDNNLEARGALPAALKPFVASVISDACSCIATPSTRRTTSTKTITSTRTSTVNGPAATTTVATGTSTSTVTDTITVTSTLPPTSTTTTVTATTTVIAEPTGCTDLQRGLQGFIRGGAPFTPVAIVGVENGIESCYNYCKTATLSSTAQSYVYAGDNGTADGPGTCYCVAQLTCSYFQPSDTANYAGDLAAPV